MSHSAKQAATRHLPVARGPRTRDTASEARVRVPSKVSSESRLQAAVARQESGTDPYANVPCTD